MQLRCYHFGNMYLSSIQQGIQAAHAQMEMFVKYNENCEDKKARDDLYFWANDHKTMICLNGGYASNMQEIVQLLSSKENPYAWAPFYESTEAMAGLLTNIAIILPENIYSVSKYQLENPTIDETLKLVCMSEFDLEMITLKNSYRLAQ